MPLPRFSPRRELGRTGFAATVLGIGDIADRSMDSAPQVETLRRALDAGLNVIDTAPGYEDGLSETIVGEALRGRDRDSVFVISKIDFLDRPVAPQIDGSLARMGLGHADLFVFHAVSTVEQWEALAAPGGAFDELAECVRAGRTRFRGISCHNPDVLLRAIPSGLCDVAMFPVGPAVDVRYIQSILPLCREHGVGTVCFKTFGAGKLLGDTLGYGRPLRARPRGKFGSGGASEGTATLPRLDVATCVRYTLTLDPDVALLGLSVPSEQDAALSAAAGFAPFSAAELRDVERRAIEAIEGKGGRHWDPQ